VQVQHAALGTVVTRKAGRWWLRYLTHVAAWGFPCCIPELLAAAGLAVAFLVLIPTTKPLRDGC